MGKPNWENRTMWTGDNLDIMRGMNSQTVDLIYLDPPFNSNRNYSAPIGSAAAGAAFKDTWTLSDVDDAWHGEIAERKPALYAVIDTASLAHGKGMKSYLIMMAVRLLEMKRILKDTGSIYLHCDPTASHYLKMLMDVVFGQGQFRNEVMWKRQSSHNRAKRWGPIHDCLLYFSKGSQTTWNRVLQPLDQAYVQQFYRYSDEHGQFMVDNLTGPGLRGGDTGGRWQNVDPSQKGRHWELPPDRALPTWFKFPVGYAAMTARQRLNVLDEQGLLYWPPKGSIPRFKRYLTPDSGAPITDIVLDIPPISAKAKERLGYPTQKPIALLDRIIKASSNEGDVILDPFCGCATALVAADRLDRQWIGIDLSSLAAKLVLKRLREDRGPLFDDVIHRTDILRRTDQGDLPSYRKHKHALYGKQEGRCGGCKVLFPFRNFTVDHVVPSSKGGTDHIDNLQLLCGACNSMKGDREQAYLLAKLKLEGIIE